jgi:hypothetical protein
MHSPSCRGTFVRYPWVCAWRPASGLQRTGFCRPPVRNHITLQRGKVLRDFTLSVPSERDIGGMS